MEHFIVKTSRTLLATLLVAVIGLSACNGEFGTITWDFTKKKPDIEADVVDTETDDLADSAAYRDTIAEQGWIEGLRKMRVRGFGIVAGLGDRGSRECPRAIRDRLIQDMYKRPEFRGTGLKPAPVKPEQIIDDADTAVVVIEGEITAAAVKGDRFDLQVEALPGTQTTSLEGGRLYTTDLHVYRNLERGGNVEGKVLASAAGAVFINPFTDAPDAATQANVREGFVLGGGTVQENRRVRFVLSNPSYRRSRAIAECINARFAATRKVAEAESPAYIELRIPRRYQHDPFRFLALLRHLYLPRAPGFTDRRTAELAKEILAEDAPHADIALAWEGIGRTALPVVQKLYTDAPPHASFYAALAGLRMGDTSAIEILGQFASDRASPYRLTAIEELGLARNVLRAARPLRELLDDPDPRIRVEAYEALLARSDRVIETRWIGGDHFALDHVPSSAGNLIYVRRTGEPRIALFGDLIQCVPPVFYRAPDGSITINAQTNDKRLTLVRKTTFGDRLSPPLAASFSVEELIGMLGDNPEVEADQVHGLALDYSSITRALHELCRAEAINARFMLQTHSVTEMFGPLTPTGRAESDL